MEFSLDRFYRLNRRAIFWIIFFVSLWLLKDLFTLVFLTFIIGFFSFPAVRLLMGEIRPTRGFFAFPIVRFLVDRLRLNRMVAVTAVYLVILVGYIALVLWMAPSLATQLGRLEGDIPSYKAKVTGLHAQYSDAEEYPEVAPFLKSYVPAADLEKWMDTGHEEIRKQLRQGARPLLFFGANFLLAILFSFLITLDFFRLVKVVQSLKSSRLRDFYEEAGQPVVRFALAVGRGFQALSIIALMTTLLMLPVLIWFKVPQLELLAVVIFFSSLVPVVGVVFEALPLGLITLNEHGVNTAVYVLIGMTVVHTIITYAVAPIIFGRHFRLNIVVTLIILLLGGRFFGMWGIILGVPIANYIIRDVFAVPLVEEIEAKKEERKKKVKLELPGDDAGIAAKRTTAQKS